MNINKCEIWIYFFHQNDEMYQLSVHELSNIVIANVYFPQIFDGESRIKNW